VWEYTCGTVRLTFFENFIVNSCNLAQWILFTWGWDESIVGEGSFIYCWNSKIETLFSTFSTRYNNYSTIVLEPWVRLLPSQYVRIDVLVAGVPSNLLIRDMLWVWVRQLFHPRRHDVMTSNVEYERSVRNLNLLYDFTPMYICSNPPNWVCKPKISTTHDVLTNGGLLHIALIEYSKCCFPP